MLPVEQPFKTYTGLDGKPLNDGYVYFGQPNQNPENPSQRVTVFWDAAGTIPAAQPLRTVNGYIMRSGTPANVFFDGAYSELVQDSKKRQVFYARTSAEFSVVTYVLQQLATVTNYLQLGLGAVVRPLIDKVREPLSVQDFGIIGNGAADDTAGLKAAVAAAAVAGKPLRWNGAVCLVSGNIPGLHGVKHRGPGQVKRGSSTFNISGSGAANLYVSQAGSSSNDGLTADFPMQSLQAALLAVANYGPVATQKFNIYKTAGTFPAPSAITHYTPSLQLVDIIGADVGGARNVPTTIIDGTGGAVYAHGIYGQGWGVRMRVQDVKLVNFNNGGGNSADRTRGGIVFDRGAEGYTKNVHVIGASWFGIYGTSAIGCFVESGILDGCRIGVNTDHTRCSVGINALVAGSARPLIKNSTEQGIAWSNGTQGHVDYCDLEDNALALHIEGGSRCDSVSNNFKRNSVAVDIFPGGSYGGNPAAPSNFNVGTADANVVDIRTYAGGSDYNGLQKNSTAEAEVDRYRGNQTITGDTVDHVIYTSTAIPSGFFKDSRQRIRIAVYGIVTSSTLPPSLKVTVAGVPLASMVMPANAIPSQGFKFEIEMFSNGTGNHYVFQKLSAGTATLDRVSSGSYNFSFTDAAKDIAISAALQAAGDTLTINRISILAAG
jgi:hypothetical protein